MLDLGKVRSFVVLASELNFSRAARRLNMTQPPLSRQIKLLEEELQVVLLERTSRRVALTSAGHVFLSEAQKLLAQSELSVVAARKAALGTAGTVKIGFVGAATYSFLPKLITMARSGAPQIELELVQMESADQVRSINEGRIDIGFSRPLLGSHNLNSVCVAREPLALAIPRIHPLAKRRRVRLEDLHEEPFIMFSREARYLHDKLSTLVASADISPRIVQQMTHSQAILSLVSVGIGLAIVPQDTQTACFDDVVFRALDLGEKTIAELHAIWSPENRNPLLSDIRNIATHVLSQT
jgi:DNA-binding transcriptional LysR family regulator